MGKNMVKYHPATVNYLLAAILPCGKRIPAKILASQPLAPCTYPCYNPGTVKVFHWNPPLQKL